jgi:hypothetical protein
MSSKKKSFIMSMQLMSHAFTTTSTRKRKTSNKGVTAKYSQDWVDYNKQMKRIGSKTKTFDEYVSYRKGNYNPKLRGTPLPDYQVSDHRQKYPSGDGIGVTFARKENTYTGTLIKGISVLHKSNAVPVTNNEQILEIAKMRRG